MNQGMAWFIFIWVFVLIGMMAIGGYFMFRKFLKVLPKADGKSTLDWQNYWVEASRHLWTDDSKQFLNRLVEPVPAAFRDIAKHSIAARIGQLAMERGAKEVTREHCIEGYILATPKRDYKFLQKFLNEEGIDYSKFQSLME
ncbi:DUF2621 family protein [Paenibacillus thermotolerans]|uniref:DUF2621 family protein n=1 Tax=Paenibacillus thermotolerans TaxID=3027807 RepID=UPI002367FE07|nr:MULTISPECIES: DUF2621 family protein [unclassified Paenibacillus]